MPLTPVDIRYLVPQFFQLSKSTFVKGMQCAKYLYLNKYKPKERSPRSAATLQKFSEGKSFEAIFKHGFPQGIDVAQTLGRDVYTMGASYTEALLREPRPITLFEACFIHRQTLVMTDVLLQNEDHTYTIYEIKNSKELKEVFLWDLSLQYFVCKAALPGSIQFNIVLNDGDNGYYIKDLTELLQAREEEVSESISRFLDTLHQDKTPKIKMGAQCDVPYECEFKAYCSR
ncbi:hypothetical protein DBR32_11510 [Taibaiella sp. KBW10]|uniref:hypothetical protein n=1 Tax=Taibaiella sp. KBW10 TaxID=2153357 RepID=UPI000F598061|nr:hypothetical protein [Taibaiella sp. KBW10]RQO30201.1 hypothetical protein DBR32_11510 [Taibaiella sp. KBW10]